MNNLRNATTNKSYLFYTQISSNLLPTKLSYLILHLHQLSPLIHISILLEDILNQNCLLAYDYLPIQRLSSWGWSAALSLEAVPERLKLASLLLFVLNPAGLQQQLRSPPRTHDFSLQSFNLMQFVFALLLLLLVSQSRRPVAAFSDNLSIFFSSTFIINYPAQNFLFSLCPINSIDAIILFKVFMPLFFILLEPFLYSTYTKVYTSLKHHLIFYRCSPAEALGQGVGNLLGPAIRSILYNFWQKTDNFLFTQQDWSFALNVRLLTVCFYSYVNLSSFPCSVLQRLKLTPTHDLVALAGPELVLRYSLSQLILEHVPRQYRGAQLRWFLISAVLQQVDCSVACHAQGRKGIWNGSREEKEQK